MNITPSLRPLLAGAAMSLAALSLAGCVVAPVGPYGARYGSPYGAPYGDQVVAVAPPSPQYEVVGAPPVVGYVWIGGFWNWIGGRHVWVGGHWDAPRPGYRWQPHRWEQAPYGWRQHPGRWER